MILNFIWMIVIILVARWSCKLWQTANESALWCSAGAVGLHELLFHEALKVVCSECVTLFRGAGHVHCCVGQKAFQGMCWGVF